MSAAATGSATDAVPPGAKAPEAGVGRVPKPAGPLRRPRFWLGVLGAGALLAGGWLLITKRPPTPLPVLYTLPTFALIDEQGRRLGSAELAGRPYVANFIYTGCHDSCPQLTARMGRLQDLLGPPGGASAEAGAPLVRLVSFSVDPERDTAPVLSAYARAARADPGRWSFVTGPMAEVAPLLHDGFKVPMVHDEPEIPGDPAPPPGTAPVIHDDHFVVVDGQGRIRGYFPSDAEGLQRIRAALKQLILER